jgi:transposase InsO family protein
MAVLRAKPVRLAISPIVNFSRIFTYLTLPNMSMVIVSASCLLVNQVIENLVNLIRHNPPKVINFRSASTDWFDDYNSYHPHSARGYLPPTLYREKRSVT